MNSSLFIIDQSFSSAAQRSDFEYYCQSLRLPFPFNHNGASLVLAYGAFFDASYVNPAPLPLPLHDHDHHDHDHHNDGTAKKEEENDSIDRDEETRISYMPICK